MRREELIKNGERIVFYRSEILPSSCRHGFFTSDMDLNPLTCEADILRENINRIASTLDFDPSRLVSVKQIHSADVRNVGKCDGGKFYFRPSDFECDGYVTLESGTALGVRSADCVPILLCAVGECGELVSVSAIHAGWRGTVGQIAVAAVRRMCSIGAVPERIFAAVGPSICRNCFEVGCDFVKAVRENLGESACRKYIMPSKDKNEKFYADLWSMNRDQLLSCGLLPQNVDICGICTCCDPHEFFSHRGGGKFPHGTQISVIVMP